MNFEGCGCCCTRGDGECAEGCGSLVAGGLHELITSQIQLNLLQIETLDRGCIHGAQPDDMGRLFLEIPCCFPASARRKLRRTPHIEVAPRGNR